MACRNGGMRKIYPSFDPGQYYIVWLRGDDDGEWWSMDVCSKLGVDHISEWVIKRREWNERDRKDGESMYVVKNECAVRTVAWGE